jgi:hypothetical protein
MSDDLKDLPEIDYENPDTKKWIKQEDDAFRNRHPNLTYEEASKSIDKRISKLKKN